jgi:hypothetical protein
MFKKKCKVCNTNKDLDNFAKHSSGKYGVRTICKECNKQLGKIYRQENKEKISEYGKRKTKEGKNQEYRDKNRKQINANKRKRHKYRMKHDIVYRLKHTLRSSIHTFLDCKNIKKNIKTQKLLGCTVAEFKAYLENKFYDGMAWDNYGLYGWHIDHIVPCMAFDPTSEEQQKLCYHYTNFQPLWAKDHQAKTQQDIQKYRTN